MLIIMGVSLLTTLSVVTHRINRPTNRCAFQLSEYGNLINERKVHSFFIVPLGAVSS
jgi:hypothetical protein